MGSFQRPSPAPAMRTWDFVTLKLASEGTPHIQLRSRGRSLSPVAECWLAHRTLRDMSLRCSGAVDRRGLLR
jgi:hypothetical protein